MEASPKKIYIRPNYISMGQKRKWKNNKNIIMGMLLAIMV